MKVFCLLAALLILTLCNLSCRSKSEKKDISTIYQDVRLLLEAKTAQVLWKILVLSIQNIFGSKYVDLERFAIAMYTELAFFTYYKWSVGIFGREEEGNEKIKSKPFFRRYILLMLFGVTIISSQSMPQELSPIQLSSSLFTLFLSGIILFIVWVYMVHIMWRNSKITQRMIVDPIFADKYQRSRLCLTYIPIAVYLVSFGGVIVVMSAVSNGCYSCSGDFGKYMGGNATPVLEYSLNQSYLFVLFRHLYEFCPLFVQWAFFFIWKHDMLHRVEIEDIYGKEVAEESG